MKTGLADRSEWGTILNGPRHHIVSQQINRTKGQFILSISPNLTTATELTRRRRYRRTEKRLCRWATAEYQPFYETVFRHYESLARLFFTLLTQLTSSIRTELDHANDAKRRVKTPVAKRIIYLLSTKESATTHAIATIVTEVAIPIADGDGSAVITAGSITLKPSELICRPIEYR